MLLTLARAFLDRYPSARYLSARLLRHAPRLDRWLRSVVNRRLNRPSPLRVDADHLPEAARDIYQRLQNAVRNDSKR